MKKKLEETYNHNIESNNIFINKKSNFFAKIKRENNIFIVFI